MKSKKDLLVPAVITDPALEEEGLYTADELKWSARDLLTRFAEQFESLGKPIIHDNRSFLIAKEKPEWILKPLSTVSAAAVSCRNEEGNFFEIPVGVWAGLFESFEDSFSKGEVEISVDIPRERVLTSIPGELEWICPMHRTFFMSIEVRLKEIFRIAEAESFGPRLEDLHLIFFPFAKKVSFFLYPDSAVA